MSFGIAQGCFHWVFPSEFALEWPHSRGERLWQGSEGTASLGPLLCAQAAVSWMEDLSDVLQQRAWERVLFRSACDRPHDLVGERGGKGEDLSPKPG